MDLVSSWITDFFFFPLWVYFSLQNLTNYGCINLKLVFHLSPKRIWKEARRMVVMAILISVLWLNRTSAYQGSWYTSVLVNTLIYLTLMIAYLVHQSSVCLWWQPSLP